MSQYKFVYTFEKKKSYTKSTETKTEEKSTDKSVTSGTSVTLKKYTRSKKPRCYT